MTQRKHAALMKQWADDDSLVAWYLNPRMSKFGWKSLSESFPSWNADMLYELHPEGVTPNWITWTGGECPVHPETVVKFVTGNGHMEERKASMLAWQYERGGFNIICYRVIKEHVPKNCTVRKWLWNLVDKNGDIYLHKYYFSEEDIDLYRTHRDKSKIHSRTDQYIDVEEPVND